MNGKQAKRIRKAIKAEYPDAKSVAYRFHKFDKQYTVLKGKGLEIITLPHKHVWMDFCHRALSKKVKKNYKKTGKIEV